MRIGFRTRLSICKEVLTGPVMVPGYVFVIYLCIMAGAYAGMIYSLSMLWQTVAINTENSKNLEEIQTQQKEYLSLIDRSKAEIEKIRQSCGLNTF